MLKTCEWYFYVGVGPSYWIDNMHYSLLICIYLPLLHCLMWTLRRSKLFLEVDRKLRLMQKEKIRLQGIVLRQFLAFSWRLPGMSDDLAW